MSVGWLLEAEMFPDYGEELAKEIVRQGHVVKFVPELNWGYRRDEAGSTYLKLFEQNSCVVFHGSLELASLLSEDSPWQAGNRFTWNHYECSTYYCHLSKYLLNENYLMLPFGELNRRKDFLFELLSKDDAIFVRPNSCRKSFTGQLAHRNSFEKDLEFMAFYDVPPEAIVLVSSPKVLTREWRFVVADSVVVASSQYKQNGKLHKQHGTTPNVAEFANQIAKGPFQPDPVWVFDLCETSEGEIRLLEIGCFSFAELYACDMAAVVRAVSASATRVTTNSP